MEKQQLIDLAYQLKFTFSDEEFELLCKDFEVFSNQIDILSHIDTNDVEAMVYPFDNPRTYLREDEVDHVCSKEDILKNSNNNINGYFSVPKVVK